MENVILQCNIYKHNPIIIKTETIGQ